MTELGAAQPRPPRHWRDSWPRLAVGLLVRRVGEAGGEA
jgi:hypothetical protein